MSSATPQFPLGSVLFPGMMLPLHVFELRYRTMIEHVLATDGHFGVVLIERGHEVGGGDRRVDVGTLARIVKAEHFDDGRWALLVVGTDRFRVVSWDDDAPYPQAEIELWPDASDRPAPDETLRKLTRCLALSAELGLSHGQIPPREQLAGLASLPLLAHAPLGSYDKQQLLATAHADDRLVKLETMLDDTIEVLELQLGDGGV